MSDPKLPSEAACIACGAKIVPVDTGGVPDPLVDWRPKGAYQCEHPPWHRCRFFLAALIAFMSQKPPS